jgi:hypothetical protein
MKALCPCGIGDWGADTTAQYAMAAGMDTVAGEIDAKQVFALGDNFYHSAKSGCPEGSGICNGGKDGPDGMNRFKTTFEDVYNGSNLLKIPFYAIVRDEPATKPPAYYHAIYSHQRAVVNVAVNPCFYGRGSTV